MAFYPDSSIAWHRRIRTQQESHLETNRCTGDRWALEL